MTENKGRKRKVNSRVDLMATVLMRVIRAASSVAIDAEMKAELFWSLYSTSMAR